MKIKDPDEKIRKFDNLLQKMTTNMTSEIIFEKLLPSELLERFEADLDNLMKLAEHLKEIMLIYKPEKALTIKKGLKDFFQPLNEFKQLSSDKKNDNLLNSKFVLEKLRKVIVEGTKFFDLSKNIRNNPSKGILTILKMKEMYKTKDYLSTITIPETIFARFSILEKNIKNTKVRIYNLEKTIVELNNSLSGLKKVMSTFRQTAKEKSKNKKIPTSNSHDEK
jgi:hypothetical protein